MGAANPLDFMDLFIFIFVKIMDASEDKVKFVSDPLFMLGKELLLSVVEVVLVFEGQSSGGIYDKFDCYKACMTTHGYKTSYTCDYPQQYAALCHDQCNYSFNSCHLVDKHTAILITGVTGKLIISAVAFFTLAIIYSIYSCMNRPMKEWENACGVCCCGHYSGGFHAILLAYNVIFGILAFVGAWMWFAAGDRQAETIVLVIIGTVDLVLTFAEIYYAIHAHRRNKTANTATQI